MTTEEEMRAPLTGCDEIAALLAAGALGEALEPAESARVLSHVQSCRACQRRMADYTAVSARLPLLVPETDPPPALRARIMDAARVGMAPAAPRRRRTWSPRSLLLPALSLGLVALAVVSVLLGLQLRQQERQIRQQEQRSAAYRGEIVALLGNDDADERPLDGSGAASDAYGRLLYAPSAGVMGVYVKHLPPLPPGRTYQVWLISGAERTSGGTFSVDQDGRAWLIVRPDQPIESIEAVGITEEPEGGSAGPTGPRVIGGTL